MLNDRTFRALIVLTLVNTVGFVLAVTADPPWPSALTWVFTPIIVGLAARLSLRVKPDPAASPAVHRYWRVTTVGLVVFCSAAALRLLDAIGIGVPLVPIATVAHAVGGILMTVPLFLLPLDRRTDGRTAAHWLDVGALMAAAAILIYHFIAPTATGPLSVLAVMVLGLTGVYVGAMVVLASVEWMSRRALYAIGVASVIGGLGSAVSLLLPLDLNTNPLILLLPLAAFGAALSARLQVVDTAATARPPRPRRSYSLMPYVAVAAVYALLIRTAFTEPPDHLLVEGVAVLLTGIVIVRQLIALRQNEGLLTRIGVQEKRFRLLVQNSTDVVTITELDGAISYISPAVHRVLGLDPDTVTGADIADRLHPDDQAVVAANVARVAAEPDATATYQMRLLHPDGMYRRLEVISANLLDEPSIGGLVSNSRDITETRQVQDRLSYQATHGRLQDGQRRARPLGRRCAAGPRGRADAGLRAAGRHGGPARRRRVRRPDRRSRRRSGGRDAGTDRRRIARAGADRRSADVGPGQFRWSACRTAGSPASRPWSAGGTRPTACWPRGISSPRPSTPA